MNIKFLLFSFYAVHPYHKYSYEVGGFSPVLLANKKTYFLWTRSWLKGKACYSGFLRKCLDY